MIITFRSIIKKIDINVIITHDDFIIITFYLVDTFSENDVVWGVGRGSSVASYCLYLIGLHKIDSIKYELDIKEFLK